MRKSFASNIICQADKVMMKPYREQVGGSAGWCLDGFPSNENEAKLLKDRGVPLSKLIVVDTPDDDLIRLAVGRRMDLESHTIFHCESIFRLHPFIGLRHRKRHCMTPIVER